MNVLIEAIKKDQAESALELLKDENIRSNRKNYFPTKL